MKHRRHERMEGLIQKEVSELIGNDLDVFDGFFITITGVDVSPNYRNVKIYYSVLGDDETKKKLAKTFAKCKSQIRFGMGNRINFRAVPEFKFLYDETVDRAARIENILSNVKKDWADEDKNEE